MGKGGDQLMPVFLERLDKSPLAKGRGGALAPVVLQQWL